MSKPLKPTQLIEDILAISILLKQVTNSGLIE